MPDRIEKSVELAAPIERVWRAIVDHREFGEWFKVRLDQPFAIGTPSTGNITYPGYEHMQWHAEIVAIEEPHRFAYRWPHMDADMKVREDWPSTLVEFRLEPTAAGGTHLTVTESGFDALPDAVRDRNFEGNERGWAEQMDNIKAHVGG